MRYADRIAYINHDIDDALRAGILKPNSLPSDIVNVLGTSTSERISTLVYSLINNSVGGNLQMDSQVAKAYDDLHSFMFEYVYNNSTAKNEEKKVPQLVEKLYNYYKAHPEKLHSVTQNMVEIEGIDRAVCDFIAGMTDHYAIQVYSELFVPKRWSY